MRALISRSLLDRIRSDCRSAEPFEACGLLLGEGEWIVAALPARNVASDPARGFEVDPAVLLAAHKAARVGGPRVAGCYHSHPSGDLRPSQTDAEMAAPDGMLWLIVSGEHHALWQAVPEGSTRDRFDYAALRVESDERVPWRIATMAALGQPGASVPAADPAAADAACHDDPVGAEGAAVSTAPASPPEPQLATDPIEFASLLCSRLCHDLLSPVGAINNGLELLADERDPEMRQRCLDLLAESARASANKLKFFRLAFGAAGGFGETVDPREARSAVEGLFGDNGRIALGWMLDEQPLPKPALKVLLNLVLIAGDALIRGGRLDIGAESRGATMEIVVRAEGGRLVLDEELRGALLGTGGDAPVTPRAAAAFLVRALVAGSAGQLQVLGPEDGVLVLGATMGLGSTAP